MFDALVLAAVADTPAIRLGVCAAAALFGALFIFIGFQNIKTQSASESGKRRVVNQAMGKSNAYEGSKAVMIGWMRVVLGIVAIIFGIVYIFVGPFLAQ